MSVLTEEIINRYDGSNLRAVIEAFPGQLRDALAIASDVLKGSLGDQEYTSVVLGGLGGSAIGGDLVRSYLTDDIVIPFEIIRGYDLPEYVDEDTLVIISSYSGNTEESLSLLRQAIERDILPVCITSGGELLREARAMNLTSIVLPQGFQPRAALAYSFTSVLLILQAAEVCSPQIDHIENAILLCEELSQQYSELSDDNQALSIAQELKPFIPVIYSANDVLGIVNLRWRGQIQENAKHLVFGNVLPEMNHNEILAWDHPEGAASKFKILYLRSSEDEHPRVEKRFDILEGILQDKGLSIRSIHAQGVDRLSRMFSLLVLADWVSFYLAMLNETDPTPIPAIDQLKAALG